MDIQNYDFERLACCLLPKIQKFYVSEEGQKIFNEWKDSPKKNND